MCRQILNACVGMTYSTKNESVRKVETDTEYFILSRHIIPSDAMSI